MKAEELIGKKFDVTGLLVYREDGRLAIRKSPALIMSGLDVLKQIKALRNHAAELNEAAEALAALVDKEAERRLKMGYTHYWNGKGSKRDASKFAEFSTVARIAIDLATSRGIELGDLMGEGGEPEVNEKRVAFNGVGDDSHESFVVTPDQTDFEFCKTNYKPYDVVVVAVLVLFKHFFPEIKFSSDGDLSELAEGVALASEALGKTLVLRRGREGYDVVGGKEGEAEGGSKSFEGDELELLKYAVSFLVTHVEDASDELDVEIDEDAVKALEDKLYG